MEIINFYSCHRDSLINNQGLGYCIVDNILPSDVCEDVLSKFLELKNEGQFKNAGMGSTITNWKSDAFRGDKILFYDSSQHPSLSMLDVIADDVIEKMNSDSKFSHFHLTGNYSIQLAAYEDGKGYTRHVDTPKDQNNDEERTLTLLVYLNKDWGEEEGGCLRLFNGKQHEEKEEEEIEDISPIWNRGVMFRSHHVEHEVLPTFGRERMAVTFWFMGRPDYSNHLSNSSFSSNHTNNKEGRQHDDQEDQTFRDNWNEMDKSHPLSTRLPKSLG